LVFVKSGKNPPSWGEKVGTFAPPVDGEKPLLGNLQAAKGGVHSPMQRDVRSIQEKQAPPGPPPFCAAEGKRLMLKRAQKRPQRPEGVGLFGSRKFPSPNSFQPKGKEYFNLAQRRQSGEPLGIIKHPKNPHQTGSLEWVTKLHRVFGLVTGGPNLRSLGVFGFSEIFSENTLIFFLRSREGGGLGLVFF